MGYILNLTIMPCCKEKKLKFINFSHKKPSKISFSVAPGEEISAFTKILFVIDEINNCDFLEKHLQKKLDSFLIEREHFSEEDINEFQYLVFQWEGCFYYIFYGTGVADTCCILQVFPSKNVRIESSYMVKDSPKCTYFQQDVFIEFD